MASAVLVHSAQHIMNNSVFQADNDIENRLKSEIFRKQIRIKEFFQDFDRLRKGYVTEDKFISALAMLGFHIKESEVKELINRYKLNDGLINYTEFCNKIENQFYEHEKARENLQNTKTQALYSPNEQDVIHQLLLQIKHQIRTRRIMLKQPFQDFDRTRSSHITSEQFARVLTQLNLMPVPSHLFDLVARKYVDNGNMKEINYVRFCEDVDNVQEMLKNVIIGVRPNPKQEKENDYVDDPTTLNMMNTLYTSKKLTQNNKELDEVIKKVQAEVVMKRVRVREFFKDYDNLRKGTVTQSQFQRVLHVLNLNLTDNEINVLIKNFKVDNIPNGLLNYDQFCEVVDEIFTIKGIDKDPLKQVKNFDESTTLPARRALLPLTEQEALQLEDLIQKYQTAVHNKKVLMKPHFEDFDVTKQGYITKHQFLRILNQFNLFPDENSLNLLLKKYIDKGNLNEVNYYRFCKDVDIYDEGVDISKSYADAFKNTVKQIKNQTGIILQDKPNDIQDLITKLRKKNKEQRMRISEFLRDFDKLRSGTITSIQLRLGLNMAKIQLSDQEFQLLLNHFTNDQGYVLWREFCDTIEEIFTQKGLEKSNPSAPVVQHTTDFNYGRQPLIEGEIEVAEGAKQRFSQFCKATRLDIKQFFQDWDKQARNKVTPKQFRQVLATVNFILSEDEFVSLVKCYQCPDSGDIKYVNFLHDTQPFHDLTLNNTSQTIPYSESKERPQILPNYTFPFQFNKNKRYKSDPQVLLETIKASVKTNRLRMGDYFKDFDGLRKGIIPSNKFRGVLSQMKIDFSEDNLQQLVLMYQIDEDQTRVNYEKFLSDVEIVFTLKELEKDPLVKPPVHVIPTFLDPKDALTQDEEQQLHNLMLRLGEVVFKHRILLKPHFQDKDRTKSGKISFPRFRSIMDFHKLPLTDQQFRILCKRFAYQGVEFNYVEFDELLKKYENSEN